MTAPARFDAVILGAGAAGLFCAAQAGQRGLSVLLVDHYAQVAEKVRISGGGRSNFTNRELDPRQPERHFISDNPAFCRSALSRYTPEDFIALVQRHRIPFHEKHKGQLFCDDSSKDLIDMLLRECEAAHVQRWQPCAVQGVSDLPVPADASADASQAMRFAVHTQQATVHARSLVIATGGLSIPKIGATDLGYRLARQYGLRVVTPRPALVPMTFDAMAWRPFAALAGLSLPVRVSLRRPGRAVIGFDEDLLFTHRGLSGPAVLQISSYWQSGQPLHVDLLPGVDLAAELAGAKRSSRKTVAKVLTQWLPARLADTWVERDPAWQRPVNEVADKALAGLAASLQDWQLTPIGTEGWRKAEVTAGGVDTRDLDQKTLQARAVPGLHFIGEVVDVTGWLGGYNFQWAWSSAWACAQAL